MKRPAGAIRLPGVPRGSSVCGAQSDLPQAEAGGPSEHLALGEPHLREEGGGPGGAAVGFSPDR